MIKDDENIISEVYSNDSKDVNQADASNTVSSVLKETAKDERQLEWLMQTVGRLMRHIEHLNREQEALKIQCQRDRNQLNRISQELNQIKNRKFFQ